MADESEVVDRDEYRLVFRRIDGHMPDFMQDEPGLQLWDVEYWSGGVSYPHGFAFVTVRPLDGPVLEMIEVRESWRRHGIATELYASCRDRWPTIHVTGAATDNGRKFLESIKRTGPI